MAAVELGAERVGRFVLRMAVTGVLPALLILSACQSGSGPGTPDYPVTIIYPTGTPAALQLTSTNPVIVSSPTLDWSQITLLPLPTDLPSERSVENQAPSDTLRRIPDPFTEVHRDLLVADSIPRQLTDAEISLGRLVLPVSLHLVQTPFRVQSVEIDGFPGWSFLAFDLALPASGELGPTVRAPWGGVVMPGTMRMINDQTVQTLSVDHPLSDEQLLRATFVYSGTIQPLYVLGQQVKAGEVLFRLTRDTGRLTVLGSTPIALPAGAVLTLHASIDTVTTQASGTESLRFLRGVGLTPEGFLRDEQGLVISPVN
jgi:hypothetical protein